MEEDLLQVKRGKQVNSFFWKLFRWDRCAYTYVYASLCCDSTYRTLYHCWIESAFPAEKCLLFPNFSPYQWKSERRNSNTAFIWNKFITPQCDRFLSSCRNDQTASSSNSQRWDGNVVCPSGLTAQTEFLWKKKIVINRYEHCRTLSFTVSDILFHIRDLSDLLPLLQVLGSTHPPAQVMWLPP